MTAPRLGWATSPGSRARARVRACALALACLPLAGLAQVAEPPRIAHGVASGEVTDRSAVIWARASAPSWLRLEYDTDPGFPRPQSAPPAFAESAADYIVKVPLSGLTPLTRYHFRVRLATDGGSTSAGSPWYRGSFRTAPRPSTRAPVSFVFGGDLGSGSEACSGAGHPIFARMQELRPDFFIANGDMIYADHGCPAGEPEGASGPDLVPAVRGVDHELVDWSDARQLRSVYGAHWRRSRADPFFQQLLRSTSMYVHWGDHEVINNFGAGWTYLDDRRRRRRGYPTLVEVGREMFLLYSPMLAPALEPHRIYRSFRWGSELELFILDTRSYRDRNDLPDAPGRGKTLLGAAQLRWLEQGLAGSDATWKVVSNHVSLSVPKSKRGARDGWANGAEPGLEPTGFETELLELLRFLDAADVENIVFIAADVHFAATIRHQLDADHDGDLLRFYELLSGPLHARRRRAKTQQQLDPTLSPRLLYAEGRLYNFGHARVEPIAGGGSRFISQIWGEGGRPRPGSTFDLSRP